MGVICVAGMPRSGTSLVTQLLYRCGVSLGSADQLMPPSINNTDGYWENLRFVQLNERLLAANGGTWFAPPSRVDATPEIMADAKSIVAQFDGEESWMWKDPRNAITLPFWKTLVPSMKVLVCVRHPMETAASLVASTLIPRTLPFYRSVTRRDSPIRLRQPRSLLRALRKRREFIYEVGLELWRVYNARILEHTTASDRIVTHFDAMLANPRAELERILARIGMSVSRSTLDDAVRVVAPQLRHQRAEQVPLDGEHAAIYAQLMGVE